MIEREPKFDINPHVIRQLGAELVTDQVTALMELIKNSYDADANYVKVTIDTEHSLNDDDLFNKKHRGYIIVDDDGFGMDRNTILYSWLIISYSEKRPSTGIKPKTPKGRTPLGDKGLGRLSTQKLANICEIYTKKKNKEALHVGFNWNDFDSAPTLSEVNVDFQDTSFSKDEGTRLVLLDIIDKNAWEGTNLARFKALLCQLISPYKENRPFRVYVSINGETINLDQESDKLQRLSISDISFQYQNKVFKWHASISMRKLIGNDFDTYERIVLSDNGKRFLTCFFADKNGRYSNFKHSTDSSWLEAELSFNLTDIKGPKSLFDFDSFDPGDFSGRIQEFALQNLSKNEEWWSSLYSSFDEYKSFIEPQKGIKVYRNGFAIRPYGINGNDWLKLGEGWTKGSSYYGLRPGNVVGFVSIDEGINRHLKDKTDREGLIENEYARVFFSILNYFIKSVNQEFENLRRFYLDYKKESASDNQKVKTVSDAFKAIQDQGQKGTELLQSYEVVQIKLNDVQTRIESIVKHDSYGSGLFAQEEESLAIQTLKEVSVILDNSRAVLREAKSILRDSELLNEALTVLRPKLDALENSLLDMTELASLGLISEMVSHDLGQIADRMLGKSKELEKQTKTKEGVSSEHIYALISFINSTVSSLKSQMKHLDSSMKYSRLKTESFSLYGFLEKEEKQYYSEKLIENNIQLYINNIRDFSITTNKGRTIQVFDNLINNSLYWLQYKQGDRKILITIDKPWVYFEDNGPGIKESVENTLFSPFVTCKPEGTGRGLGLFIVQQLLDDSGCDIVLDNERNDQGRRYRFSINLFSICDKI